MTCRFNNQSKNKKMSQKQQVANYLQSGKSLTPIQALTKFGSLRLAAIIFNLKADGLKIKTELMNIGTKKKPRNVAKYSIN